jgi:membrane associated rhomboid family serine protease
MRSNWGNDGPRGRSAWLPFRLDSIPVTRALLVATVSVFLLFFFTGQQAGPVWALVPFRSEAWLTRPWTWFTYPFMEIPSLWILLTLYILYSIGGMLERSWGSVNYAAVFFALTAVGALAFVIPLYLMGASITLLGLSVPLAALVTAWAALDPDTEVAFWGVAMVKPKFIALVWVLLIYFQYGLAYGSPVIAAFIFAAPAAAWFYVRKLPRLNLSLPSAGPRPSPRAPERGPLLREDPAERERVTGFNPLRRRQEQEEIERLRKLLGEDDDDLASGRR